MEDQRFLNLNTIIEFIRKKDYVNLGPIGQGGLGKTILIKDEVINELFVCKKYSPVYEEVIEQYFSYFVDEIKILHRLYHLNIVRVFNYYLYPEKTTGYILMEYIPGKPIDLFLQENPDLVESVFLQTLDGFRYLEEKNILHRDIRPNNILINEEGIVKIIDFGFGKLTNIALSSKSISLNWRYSVPSEFADEVYDNRTEVYFVGKLFEEILNDLGITNFKFNELINLMIKYNADERIQSFFDACRSVLKNTSDQVEFAQYERIWYTEFADSLLKIISQMDRPMQLHSDIPSLIKGMEDIYRNSMLELNVSNTNKLISLFIKGNYRYFPKIEFRVSTLKAFMDFFRYIPENKQKIVLNNLWERFEKVDRIPPPDGLPF